jgi:hypothetical protein
MVTDRLCHSPSNLLSRTLSIVFSGIDRLPHRDRNHRHGRDSTNIFPVYNPITGEFGATQGIRHGARTVPWCRRCDLALPECGCNDHPSRRWRSPSRRRGRSRRRPDYRDWSTSYREYDWRGLPIQYTLGWGSGTVTDPWTTTYRDLEAFAGFYDWGDRRRRRGRRRRRRGSRGREFDAFDAFENDIWRDVDRMMRRASDAERWLWREYGT